MRQIASLAGLLIIVSLLLTVLDNRNMLDPVKSVVGDLVSPISQGFERLGSRMSDGSGGESELQAQLEQVQAERDELMAENARLRELVAEVEDLRAQLNFEQSHPELELLSANVVSRDPQSFEQFLIIDRGSEDGVQVGMAVVSPNFLVGQVVEVDPNRARVLLVIDTGFRTGARLQESRGDGILYGLWQAGGLAEVRHIPLETEVIPDERVVTSGLTSGIPEGLLIGQIHELERNDLRNEITVSVLPFADFDNLQTVSVITGQREQQ